MPPDSSATPLRMQEQPEPKPPLVSKASRSHGEAFRGAHTWLAKIAIVLQQAPGRMLTFAQLIKKLAPTASQRKSAESGIRECLSSQRCFTKIPMVQNSPISKKNLWKLDCSQITAKMVRRHFKELLQLFPELASKVETQTSKNAPEEQRDLPPPGAAACTDIRRQTFSSPFSIESLLRRDTSPQPSHTQSFSCFSREPDLHPSAGSFPVCPAGGSTHHEQPSFLCTGDAPYFTRGYIIYSVQMLTLGNHYC
ncbi:forkhead box protein H1 [Nothobranchius furzeri]|uniref:Forkhead box protein H1-like n=1 Tax=Nothobranchius furzeri TaxID=105023 RepID=A0A1A7ZGH8_NOTFU|nr:forkhead box protein H1 [Nothobranchius furzeri]KAF7210709.1 forkhead box protein H1-like [Nothobranchius furzeri]